MEDRIEQLLKKAKKPLSIDNIIEKLEVVSREEKEEVKKILDKKVADYDVILTTGNKYSLLQKTSFRKGTFVGYKGGDGKVFVVNSYINKENQQVTEKVDYKIARGDVNGAIDGDIVLIDVNLKDRKNNKAKIVNVIERSLNNVMGEVYRVGSTYYVRPIDKKKQNITIVLEGEAIEGQRVDVSLESTPGPDFYVGKIVRVFNHKDDPDADILWEAFKCGIDDVFSDESLEQVKRIPQKVLATDKIGRVDLTDREIFTIDGADTKDIDDALSCRILPNGNFELGVHIADVSNYVPVNSPLDKDAYKKGTSAYLAGKVIPMLPHELSNGICSLNPFVERLALSCIMEISPNGEVVRYDIVPSVIKSQLKMTYDCVNQILKDGVIPEEYSEHAEALRLLNKIALISRRNRIKKGAIEFDRPELKPIYGENGKVVDFSIRIQDVGENLIEECMLLANETVDKHLTQIGAPCLHRIHDFPQEEKIMEFMQMLNLIGFDYKDSNVYSQKGIQKLADYVKDTGRLSNMLSASLIKCMPRAKYSPENIGHCGLAKSNYCHFTSPIRRYPDLTIHRILKDCSINEDKDGKKAKKWMSKLPEIGANTSKMERVADTCEMQTLAMKCSEYMQAHQNYTYEGTIVGLSDHGITIQLDNLVEGRIRPKNLRGEYTYNPETYTLISLDGNEDYYIGDRLLVKVISADKENKTIDFKVMEKLEESKIRNASDKNQYVKSRIKEERKYLGNRREK